MVEVPVVAATLARQPPAAGPRHAACLLDGEGGPADGHGEWEKLAEAAAFDNALECNRGVAGFALVGALAVDAGVAYRAE